MHVSVPRCIVGLLLAAAVGSRLQVLIGTVGSVGPAAARRAAAPVAAAGSAPGLQAALRRVRAERDRLRSELQKVYAQGATWSASSKLQAEPHAPKSIAKRAAVPEPAGSNSFLGPSSATAAAATTPITACSRAKPGGLLLLSWGMGALCVLCLLLHCSRRHRASSSTPVTHLVFLHTH